jgi:cytoskeletal protein RodZ
MKVIKICLAIIVVLLTLGIGFGVYVWYTIQHVPTAADIPALQQSSGASVDGNTSPVSEGSTENTAPIVIETDTLSETQQGMLKSMGYTKDTVTITPAMITCAENAVGAARLKEITSGAAPSPLESMKLLPCFKS